MVRSKQPKHRRPKRPDGTRMRLGSNIKDGVRVCRWCSRPVPPPKLTFCGKECIHEWKIRSNAQYRKLHVDLRDNGICAICGTDTYEQQDRFKTKMQEVQYRTHWSRTSKAWPAAMGPVVREAMFDGLSTAMLFRLVDRATPYDIDHAVPLIEGGDQGMQNLRTLCLPCHHRETQALRKRLKAKT